MVVGWSGSGWIAMGRSEGQIKVSLPGWVQFLIERIRETVNKILLEGIIPL